MVNTNKLKVNLEKQIIVLGESEESWGHLADCDIAFCLPIVVN